MTYEVQKTSYGPAVCVLVDDIIVLWLYEDWQKLNDRVLESYPEDTQKPYYMCREYVRDHPEEIEVLLGHAKV